MKYSLTLKNGTVQEETGHFFKALPFTVSYSNQETLDLHFERGPTGKVVFKIIQNNKVLEICQHPDYVPESTPGTFLPPESLSTPLHYAMSAFAYLGIIKTPDYLKHFHPVNGELKLSFRATQQT